MANRARFRKEEQRLFDAMKQLIDIFHDIQAAEKGKFLPERIYNKIELFSGCLFDYSKAFTDRGTGFDFRASDFEYLSIEDFCALIRNELYTDTPPRGVAPLDFLNNTLKDSDLYSRVQRAKPRFKPSARIEELLKDQVPRNNPFLLGRINRALLKELYPESTPRVYFYAVANGQYIRRKEYNKKEADIKKKYHVIELAKKGAVLLVYKEEGGVSPDSIGFNLTQRDIKYLAKTMSLLKNDIEHGRICPFEISSVEESIKTEIDYRTTLALAGLDDKDSYEYECTELAYFYPTEFRKDVQIKKLCSKIQTDMRGSKIDAPDNSINWLNTVLENISLFQSIRHVIREPNKVEDLPCYDEIRLLCETSFEDLSISTKKKTLLFNRALIEYVYKGIAPRLKNDKYNCDRLYDDAHAIWLNKQVPASYSEPTPLAIKGTNDEILETLLDNKVTVENSFWVDQQNQSVYISFCGRRIKTLKVKAETNFAAQLLHGGDNTKYYNAVHVRALSSFETARSFKELLDAFFIYFQYLFGSFDRLKTCKHCGRIIISKRATTRLYCGNVCKSRDFYRNFDPQKQRCLSRENEFISRWYNIACSGDSGETFNIHSLSRVDCINCPAPVNQKETCTIALRKNPKLFNFLKTHNMSNRFKK